MMHLFRFLGTRRAPTYTKPEPRRFRPTLESLEARDVPSATPMAAPVLGPALVSTASPVQQLVSTASTGQQLVNQAMNLNITGITAQNGQLLATGTLGGIQFTSPLSLTTSPNPADPSCPILDLRLNAIHLDLLGLKVDTSNICLNITAESGSGNLLGNLLCNVANLLNTGTPLSNILNGLTANDLQSLTSGLTSLFTGAGGVNSQLAGAATGSSSHSQSGTCSILDLSLGPVNLNLLGLDVTLDNCANGPVTVAVTAQSGPGNLLGNLLCDVTHLLDNTSASTSAIGALLNDVNTITGTLGTQVL